MGNNIDIQTSVVNEKQIELLKATRLQDGTTALDYVMSWIMGSVLLIIFYVENLDVRE